MTGLTWSTPLGRDLADVWARLLGGESGLASQPTGVDLRNDAAGCLPDADLDRSPRVRQHEITVELLIRAGIEADLDLADPGLRVALGTSYGADLDEPGGSLADWAVRAAREAGFDQMPLSVSTACSAGSDAILVGAELVRSGAAERCLAGGVDVVSTAKRLGHSALGTLSRTGLRAFDVSHDGMLPGEGGALLLLEERRAARARGAQVLAVLCGGGASNDAAGLTAPDESGDSVVLAVRRALRAAGRTADQVAVVSAHATGTVLNDEVECRSLARLFPGDRTTVFATKAALGHSLGATGAIEAVATVLALRTGLVPPMLGLHQPLAALSLTAPVNGSRRIHGGLGASITIGFGGFNTCLLFDLAGADAHA